MCSGRASGGGGRKARRTLPVTTGLISQRCPAVCAAKHVVLHDSSVADTLSRESHCFAFVLLDLALVVSGGRIPFLRIHPKSPVVRNAQLVGFGDSGSQVPRGRSLWIRANGTASKAERRTPICKPGAVDRIPDTTSRKTAFDSRSLRHRPSRV